MKNLRLLQLNVQNNKHWGRITPFLEKEPFDIICLQELNEEDAMRLKAELGLSLHFVPRTKFSGKVQGVGIFSKSPIVGTRAHWYGGIREIVEFINGSAEEKFMSQQFMLTVADIEHEGKILTIASTHFPWTPDGSASEEQRVAARALFEALTEEKAGFVLCGDFNAPRGGEIWGLFAERYKDNIPEHYTTSIDKDLHRSGGLEYVVDGIFTTPEYEVSNVERVCGLSDHCAFTAEISKAAPAKILDPNTDQAVA